ncbi:NAD-dependent deacetylase [Chloroflexota bacterium]
MEELIAKAAKDIAGASYAIALTGAGISTESGIRDFRGPQGVWTLNPEAERRAYQSYQEFIQDPKDWWENMLTKQGRPRGGSLGDLGQAMPNTGHYSLVELEKMGILKCVITQNVDALHEKAGTKNLLEYHGSTAKLRCISCVSRFRREEFDLEKSIQEDQLPPRCPKCQGIMKTDGVFFGEPIPSDVAEQSLEEAWKCDLMLICGTSAAVYPFANLPRIAEQRGAVTIIEVNAEPTPLTIENISDYLIAGKTGEILPGILEEVKKIRN